jgi:hypothetical protein
MTKPMIRIHNTETNEIVDREMTESELQEHEAKLATQSANDAAIAAKATEKAALLAKLGITDNEAKLLLS